MKVNLNTPENIEGVISVLWQDMIDGEIRTVTYYMKTYKNTVYAIVDDGDTLVNWVDGCFLCPVTNYDNAYVKSDSNSVALMFERHSVETATIVVSADIGDATYLDRLVDITVTTTDKRTLSLGEWADEWADRQIARDLENGEIEL